MKKLVVLIASLLIASLLFACGSPAEKVKVKTISLTQESYAYAISKSNTELKDFVNNYLNEISENGAFCIGCLTDNDSASNV